MDKDNQSQYVNIFGKVKLYENDIKTNNSELLNLLFDGDVHIYTCSDYFNGIARIYLADSNDTFKGTCSINKRGYIIDCDKILYDINSSLRNIAIEIEWQDKLSRL